MSEERIRSYINDILLKIKNCEYIIKISLEAIDKLKKENSIIINVEYRNNRIKENRETIEEKEKELVIYKEEIKLCKRGELNDKINNIYKKNTEEVNKKVEKNVLIKNQKKESKEKDKKICDKYFKNISADRYKDRQIEREMKYSYNYYNKVVDTLPEYINNNLKTMPNNKGYVWRNMYFYGFLPKENNNVTILFEKRKDVLIIHEIDDIYHKIYSKRGRDRRILISETLRNKFIGY